MRLKTIFCSMSAFALVAGCDDGRDDAALDTPLVGTAAADDNGPTAAALASADDESLMTVTGTIATAAPGWFRLAVGDDEVTVEMDDWDWYKEGQALKAGDRVTVTGRVDKGLWEQGKLEASSVHVHNLGVTFFASGADEEETVAAVIPVDTVTSALGLVTAVEGQEFTVGSMTGPVRVDTSGVKTKPQVKLGDRVYSWGDLDLDPAEGVELMAQGVVVISPDRTKTAGSDSAQQARSPGSGTNPSTNTNS